MIPSQLHSVGESVSGDPIFRQGCTRSRSEMRTRHSCSANAGKCRHHVVGVDISAVQVNRETQLVPEGRVSRTDIAEIVTDSVEGEVRNAILNSVPFDAVVAFTR